LPPACYTPGEFFEREIERVFLRDRCFAASGIAVHALSNQVLDR